MDSIIRQKSELRGIEFALGEIPGSGGLSRVQIRLTKQFSPVMEIAVPPGRDFFLEYDAIKLGQTNICGAFTLFVEGIGANGCVSALLDSCRLFIEPPVPPRVYHDYGDILGTNYTSASSANQIEFWSRFQELKGEISGELAAAAGIGMNSLRVFFHEWVFDQARDRMLENIEAFTALCAERRIRPLYVFFDDCWYGSEERVLDFNPIPGSHNGRWAKCPLCQDRKLENYPRFERYIKDIVGRFKDDRRIFGWEIWNEPTNRGIGDFIDSEFTEDLMANGFLWVRQMNPVQPVVSCWDGNRFGDIDNQHNYAHQGVWEYNGGVGAVIDMRRGTIVTEAGCRTWNGDSYGSPVHWISWLEERRGQNSPVPGTYLNWELMAGDSNCTWHWSSKPGDRKPGVPWCGFFFPDLTPVNIAETAALRRYAGLRDKTILLYGFDRPDAPPGAAASSGKGFRIFTDGKLGELRHEGKGRDRIIFDETIKKDGFAVQVFFRIDDPEAKAGMEYIPVEKKGASWSILCSVRGVRLTLAESKVLSVSRDIPAGEMHNLKFTGSAGGTWRVFVDDLSEPLFTINAEPAFAGKLALVASGKAAFDDLGAVYDDK
ncbi:MAG: hypothetical protein LBP74_04830 [Treponema sp.]|nr:hypothetical protein [Treponema sp.]